MPVEFFKKIFLGGDTQMGTDGTILLTIDLPDWEQRFFHLIHSIAFLATLVAWAARERVIDLLGNEGKAAPSAI